MVCVILALKFDNNLDSWCNSNKWLIAFGGRLIDYDKVSQLPNHPPNIINHDFKFVNVIDSMFEHNLDSQYIKSIFENMQIVVNDAKHCG